MRIRWRDGLATLSAGGAIVLERAYFQNYDWPLVSSISWVIIGLTILAGITLFAGFAFDKYSSANWDLLGIAFGVGLATLAGLGLIYEVTDYVVLLMLSAIFIWVVSVAHHLAEPGEHKTPKNIVHA